MAQMHGGLLKQGQHPDPLDPDQPAPDSARWPPRQQQAFLSAAMLEYRKSLLCETNDDVRASVLDDLATFFHLDSQECLQRCIDWEAWSVEEWHSKPRDSQETLTEFYQTMKSWAFDLLWYAYLQAEGYRYPVSVAIAQSLRGRGKGLRHLDFGSGTGVTSQLFQRLGYETDLADLSTSLLAFARFRLERRSVVATHIDLNVTALAPGSYDVITAIDTLVHVPDLPATARILHRALKPGGSLFANFDVRPKTAENAWHLYENDLPLRWQLQRTGFEPEESLDGMITRYRWVDPAAALHRLRGLRDAALLRSPLRPVYRLAHASLSGIHGASIRHRSS